jgi:hypothetical protein
MLPIHETEAIPKFAESDFYVLGWVEGKEEGRVQGNPLRATRERRRSRSGDRPTLPTYHSERR